MAIATGLAIAAGVSAAGAVAGGAMSASASKKAANKAAAAQTDASNANNALAREQYGLNSAALAPWQQRGNTAGAAMNALLGLGGGQQQQQPAQQFAPMHNAMGGPWTMSGNGYGASNGFMARDGFVGEGAYDFAAEHGYGNSIMGAPVNFGGFGAQQPQQPQQQNNQQQYQDAFKNYQDSTGYQFRVGEGTRALDNSYASRGVGQSGAAAKAALNYGQNIASGEFGNYLNQLFGISNQGLSAANAQAGVGTNMVNQVSANNNNSASAIGNGALLNGRANANLYSGIGGAIGNVAGMFGSSFGGGGGSSGYRPGGGW